MLKSRYVRFQKMLASTECSCSCTDLSKLNTRLESLRLQSLWLLSLHTCTHECTSYPQYSGMGSFYIHVNLKALVTEVSESGYGHGCSDLNDAGK
jgi:hypothetical protein